MLPIGVGVVKQQGFSYGIGTTFIFPTSKHPTVASHQYQAGPTALAVYANQYLTVGVHVQHWWGVDRDSDKLAKNNPLANHSDIFYFIVYNLPNTWQLRSSAHITYNFNVAKNNKLTLPLAIGVGKMIKL